MRAQTGSPGQSPDLVIQQVTPCRTRSRRQAEGKCPAGHRPRPRRLPKGPLYQLRGMRTDPIDRAAPQPGKELRARSESTRTPWTTGSAANSCGPVMLGSRRSVGTTPLLGPPILASVLPWPGSPQVALSDCFGCAKPSDWGAQARPPRSGGGSPPCAWRCCTSSRGHRIEATGRRDSRENIVAPAVPVVGADRQRGAAQEPVLPCRVGWELSWQGGSQRLPAVQPGLSTSLMILSETLMRRAVLFGWTG